MGMVLEVNVILIGKEIVDKVMDVVVCIGCGVCVVICKNGFVVLFILVKINYFNIFL